MPLLTPEQRAAITAAFEHDESAARRGIAVSQQELAAIVEGIDTAYDQMRGLLLASLPASAQTLGLPQVRNLVKRVTDAREGLADG